MVATIFFLSGMIILLIMFSIFCALWDIIAGRWSKTERQKNLQQDIHNFDDE